MRITLQSAPANDIPADWLIVGVWENETPRLADSSLSALLEFLRERGDVTGKAKDLTPIYRPEGIAAKRLLLVGLGARDKADYASLLAATAAAAKMLSAKPIQLVTMMLPEGVLSPDVAL